MPRERTPEERIRALEHSLENAVELLMQAGWPPQNRGQFLSMVCHALGWEEYQDERVARWKRTYAQAGRHRTEVLAVRLAGREKWVAHLSYGNPEQGGIVYESPPMTFDILHIWIAEHYEMDAYIREMRLSKVETTEETEP